MAGVTVRLEWNAMTQYSVRLLMNNMLAWILEYAFLHISLVFLFQLRSSIIQTPRILVMDNWFRLHLLTASLVDFFSFDLENTM